MLRTRNFAVDNIFYHLLFLRYLQYPEAPPECNIHRNIHRKTLVLESLFDKVADLQVCNFIEKKLLICYHKRKLQTSTFSLKTL